MRNLHLLRNTSIKYPFLTNLKKCLVVTESSASKSTKLFVFNHFIELYQLNITDDFTFEEIFIADLFQFVDDPTETITIAGFNCIYNEVYVILSTGYLISVTISSDYDDNESFGQSLNVGITKIASWSPDFERTVLINSEDKIFILNIVNSDFEKLNEISLQDAAEEQNKFVNVGWGSVETQFRGTEGKFSKAAPREGVNADVTDDSIRVCWKQNGTAFAVTYICCAEKNRKIKIFSQDGTLLNVTKDILGLQSPVDWSPSRNLIFCPQTLPNKQVICFLEQNALRHNEFEISKETEVKEILWNLNGTILACHGVSGDREFVALWTTSNYKWYMKQRLQFNESLIYLQWDFMAPNRLHVILKSGVYRSYEWSMQIDESSKCGGKMNKAVVSIVDGYKLGVTPYASANLPPSMRFESYNLSPSYINAVIYPERGFSEADDFDCNSTILYLSDNSLSIMKYGDKICTSFLFCFKERIEFATPSELSAFIWIFPNFLFFSWCRIDGSYFCVSRFDVPNKRVVIEKMFPTRSPILSACSFYQDVIVHLHNGKLYLYRDESLHSMEICFVEPCVRLQMLNEDTLLALSENRNLYLNETIKYRDVASFYWKSPFVVVLTMDSQLLVSKVNLAGRDSSFDEVLSRGVEPKSYLITIVDDRVLLEMERGNLETIVPRPFSIFKMEAMLKKSQYSEAFKMLRKQRINLNVLFDYDPDNFFKNIKSIVLDVADPTYLLNFITELEDENVLTSMFPWKYNASNAKTIFQKVEKVCDRFCAAVKEADNPKLTVPLIAALVKQNNLVEAAQYAIKYHEISTLTHLCDPVLVYRAALASYDLVHALHVIQHSKLDPSEYLPFVHELQTLEKNYQKFKIWDYLGNRRMAFTNLSYCDDDDDDDKFEECVAYMHKYRLYRTALEVFSPKRDKSERLRARYVRILAAVAEYHFQNQCLLDAAILFEKADIYDRALSCYLSVGDWFAAMSVSKYTGLGTDRIAEISKNVYDLLTRQRKYEEAGYVAYFFVSDCQLAVDAYLMARKYCNAVDAAKGSKGDDTISQTLRSALVNEALALINQQERKLATVIAYQERLDQVRAAKKSHPDTEYNDDDRLSVISSSDSSDSGSVSSSTSRASSTTSSAKKARRRERKLWNLKPENRREEPSLLNAIREAVIQYEKEYRETVPDLIKALAKTDEFILASELKTNYEKFLSTLRKVMDRVWCVDSLPEDGAGFKDILVSCPPDITSFVNDLIVLNCE